MSEREPFTFELHQDAAALLNRVTGDLESLGHALDKSYGAKAASAVAEAMAAITRVRAVLEGQLPRDFHHAPGVCDVRIGSIYFPARPPAERRAG